MLALYIEVAVTMLCGRKVNDEADEIFKKMKVFEKLITVLTTPPKGVILDLMPWLQHCGIPVVKEIQVHIITLKYIMDWKN